MTESPVESGEAKNQPASPPSRFPRAARRDPITGLLVLGLLFAVACTSVAPRPVGRSDQFPLDPREELTGPFPEETLRGCAALSEGNASAAEAAFAAAISRGGPRLAAEIGRIEAVVLQGRAAETLPPARSCLAPVTRPSAARRLRRGAFPVRRRSVARLYRRALARGRTGPASNTARRNCAWPAAINGSRAPGRARKRRSGPAAGPRWRRRSRLAGVVGSARRGRGDRVEGGSEGGGARALP